MELPNLKEEAQKQINDLKGSVVGIVQIAIDDEGHNVVCIGGMSGVIVNILANAIKRDPQIKNFFEAAYSKSINDGFNPNLN